MTSTKAFGSIIMLIFGKIKVAKEEFYGAKRSISYKTSSYDIA